MALNPYDIERIVLGHVLKWGEQAARLLLPQLTPDKFVYSMDGELGGVEHQIIWETVREAFCNEHRDPTIAVIKADLDEVYHDYLCRLVGELDSVHLISALNLSELETYGRVVDKNGLIYTFALESRNTGHIIESNTTFCTHAKSIQDIDLWLGDQMGKFRSLVTFDHTGYQHIGDAMSRVLEMWDRQRRGEQMILLPVGMPTLMCAHLFPLGKMAVIHGLSGSGKSTFVHQVNLGTAVGLVANGIQGKVAINSLEMQKEDLIEKFVGALAHVDTSKFVDGTITDAEFRDLQYWAEFVAKLPIWIDDTNFQTTSALQYRSGGLHVAPGGPVLQLSSDYTELFRDEAGETEEQRVSKVVREHFRLSRSIGASVIVISQSTADKDKTGKTYIAGPDGTRYSRGVLQAADILAEVWNPEAMRAAGRQFLVPEGLNDAFAYIMVQKYRKGGKPGYYPLGWVPETTTFFDPTLEQAEGQELIFNHLAAAQQAQDMGARVMPYADSPLSTIKSSSNGNGHHVLDDGWR